MSPTNTLKPSWDSQLSRSATSYLDVLKAGRLWKSQDPLCYQLLLRWSGQEKFTSLQSILLMALLIESHRGRVRMEFSLEGLKRILAEHLGLIRGSMTEENIQLPKSEVTWLDDDSEWSLQLLPSSLYCEVQSSELGSDQPIQALLIIEHGSKNHIYLQQNYVSQQRALTCLRHRFSSMRLDPMPKEESLKDLFLKRSVLATGFTFHPQQAAAAIQAARSPFFLLSGGPGTGKTSVLLQMLRIFLHHHTDIQVEDIALVAPTGRAKSRMQESLEMGLEVLYGQTQDVSDRDNALRHLRSQTLHSLLGMKVSSPTMKGDSFLRHKLVVVDEASMMDIHLFARLLERLAPEARLILLGDVDQLPSVDHGAILSDLSIGSTATLSSKSYQELKGVLAQLELQGELGLNNLMPEEEQHQLCDRMVMLEHSYRSQKDILNLAQKILHVPMAHSSTTEEQDAARHVFASLEPSFSGADHSISEQVAGLESLFQSRRSQEKDERSGIFCLQPSKDALSIESLVHQWWAEMGEVGEQALWNKAHALAQDLSHNDIDIQSLSSAEHPQITEQLNQLFAQTLSHQILCLHHHGSRGTRAVRGYAQSYRQPKLKGQHSLHLRSKFVVGDRVIVTRNLHSLHLFNGDVGVILPKGSELVAIFKRGHQFIEESLHKISAYLDPADGLSVHKSQGSEYDRVMLLLPENDNPLLSKEMLYTGITRAKSLAVIVGSGEMFSQGCQRSSHRPSAIGEWVKKS